MMTIDDPRRGSPATRWASSPSVPVMVRCDGSVPSWTMAARLVSARPPSIIDCRIAGTWRAPA